MGPDLFRPRLPAYLQVVPTTIDGILMSGVVVPVPGHRAWIVTRFLFFASLSIYPFYRARFRLRHSDDWWLRDKRKSFFGSDLPSWFARDEIKRGRPAPTRGVGKAWAALDIATGVVLLIIAAVSCFA